MDNQDKLIAAIEAAEDASQSATVAEERQKALEYYNGDPFGNEISGRSQYVSKDVYSTIEWIKPALLKMFAGGDEVVRFDPVSAEDVDGAEQESDYINHIILQKNSGFLVFHNWFHDALLLKNAYVRAYWDTQEQIESEKYQGLGQEELAFIMQDHSVEVVASDVDEYGLYSVELKRKSEYGCVKIENLPPEQVHVSHSCKSIDIADADFVEFQEPKSLSELRLEGFDVADDINDGGEESYEQFIRDQQADSLNYGHEETNDPSMRKVSVRECWIRYDDNEDGKAELLHVILVGKEVLLKEEADIIPIAAISPLPTPHRHNGSSVADSVMDLQLLKSSIIRGYLDNMYLANNGRYAVSDRVNLQDMLQSRPGGVVRVDGEPGGAIMPLVHPQIGAAALQGIEYADSVLENRTGVTRYNQGIDANSLNKTASGITQIMSASQQRIELIARIFAETGVKRLFWLVHRLTKQNSTKADVARLRNKWVPVDPRTWKSRNDMTISVGLGTGNKDQMLGHLQTILMAQKEALQIGVATPKNVYEALKALTVNAGFKDSEKFWTDPSEQQPQQPQPDPDMVKVQADIALRQEQLAFEKQKAFGDHQLKSRELSIKEAELQLTAQTSEQEIMCSHEVNMAKVEQAGKPAVSIDGTAQLQGLADRLGDVASSAETNIAATAQSSEMLANVVIQLAQIAEMMARPKQVIRDQSGKIQGVM